MQEVIWKILKTVYLKCVPQNSGSYHCWFYNLSCVSNTYVRYASFSRPRAGGGTAISGPSPLSRPGLGSDAHAGRGGKTRACGVWRMGKHVPPHRSQPWEPPIHQGPDRTVENSCFPQHSPSLSPVSLDPLPFARLFLATAFGYRRRAQPSKIYT